MQNIKNKDYVHLYAWSLTNIGIIWDCGDNTILPLIPFLPHADWLCERLMRFWVDNRISPPVWLHLSMQLNWWCEFVYIYIYIWVNMYFYIFLATTFRAKMVDIMAISSHWCSPHSPSGNSLLLRSHGDVIKWKHFPRDWPFVRGSHRSPVNSPHKGQWRGAFKGAFNLCIWNYRQRIAKLDYNQHNIKRHMIRRQNETIWRCLKCIYGAIACHLSSVTVLSIMWITGVYNFYIQEEQSSKRTIEQTSLGGGGGGGHSM